MLDINVLAIMLACHEILPIMKAQGGGHIVNISSVAGRQVKAGYSGYNASKWALGAFSESLRQEVTRQQIRVTVIEPGMVATELRQHITNPMADGYSSSTTEIESCSDIRCRDLLRTSNSPLCEQYAALINEHMREGWRWRYITDEHTCRRVCDALRVNLVEVAAEQCPTRTGCTFATR